MVDCLGAVFDCSAFVVGKRDLCQHLLQIAAGFQELGARRALGSIEVTAGAGHTVRALLKEAVGAEAMAEIEVLPWSAFSGSSTLDGVTVDQHLDRAYVPSEVAVVAAGLRGPAPF